MAPVAYATPPTAGGGWFDLSIPDPNMEIWYAGDNIRMHVWGGGGYLFGTFEGKWIHDEWQTVHLADGIVTMHGVWDTPEGVTVNGVSGTVHVRYEGTADPVTGAFQGQFVIVSGTGDLANLRGQGTMWADESGAWYTIQYHFDP